MDFEVIEYHLVLLGWVTALVIGTFLLFFKPPNANSYASFRKGKNTLALGILLFGVEILFQWLI